MPGKMPKLQTPWLKMRNGMTAETRAAFDAADRPVSFDHFKMRAFQYVCARYNLHETHHRTGLNWIQREVHFDVALFSNVEGRLEKRIRAVTIGDETYQIPHWDFDPKAALIDETQTQDVFV